MRFFSSGKAQGSEPKQKINAYNIWILFLLAPASIAYGYTASIIATTLGQPSFTAYFDFAHRSNANALLGATGGVYFAGGALGPLVLPWISDRYGRRWGIAISCIINIISAAFMAGSTNIGEFIFFRFLAGASAFMLLGAVPLLMNEVVPSRMRGGLVELHAVFFIFGFVLASWIGFGFSFWTGGGLNAWRPPLALQALWSLLGLVALPFVPESPRWLVLRDREEQAEAILYRLHSNASDPEHEFARAELYQIKKQIHIDKTLGSSWGHIFRKRSYLKRVAFACGLTFFIQSGGDLVINNYSPLLYANLGFSVVKQLLYPSAWLTFTLGLSIIVMPFVDRFPRNKLVACGLWGCMAALIVECALVAEFVPSTNENALRAAVALLFIYQIPDTMMLNAPEWAYIGEMFPTHIRSKGYSLAMSSLSIANIIYTQAAPVAFETVGWRFYILFIVMCFVGGLVVWFYFPDTRHLPLEELAALFGDEEDVAVYQAEIELDSNTHKFVDHHGEKSVDTHVEDVEDRGKGV